MSLRTRKWMIFLAVVLGMIAIDQISKEWVLRNMDLGETILPIPALHPYFQFTRSFNTGAAFGILPTAGELFLVFSLLITLVILYFFVRAPQDANLQHFALSLVVGGALGNAIDRLQHGHVVDFVHLSIPGLISNVSNFADHAIVLGVALLLLDSFLRERRERRQTALATSAEETP